MVRCEGLPTRFVKKMPDLAAQNLNGFGLAGEHKNNLANAIPSKVVAGRGCEVPHRHLTTLQLQDLDVPAPDEGRPALC